MRADSLTSGRGGLGAELVVVCGLALRRVHHRSRRAHRGCSGRNLIDQKAACLRIGDLCIGQAGKAHVATHDDRQGLQLGGRRGTEKVAPC